MIWTMLWKIIYFTMQYISVFICECMLNDCVIAMNTAAWRNGECTFCNLCTICYIRIQPSISLLLQPSKMMPVVSDGPNSGSFCQWHSKIKSCSLPVGDCCQRQLLSIRSSMRHRTESTRTWRVMPKLV